MKLTEPIGHLGVKGRHLGTRALGILVLLLLVLNGLDMSLTVYLIYSGQAYEANPLLDDIFARWGFEGFIAFKTFFVWALCLLLLTFRGHIQGRILGLLCVDLIYLVNNLLTVSNMHLPIRTFLAEKLPWLIP
jgi:hypothetical protein